MNAEEYEKRQKRVHRWKKNKAQRRLDKFMKWRKAMRERRLRGFNPEEEAESC